MNILIQGCLKTLFNSRLATREASRFASTNFFMLVLRGTYVFQIQSLKELVEWDVVLVAEFPEAVQGVAFDDVRGEMNVVDAGRWASATHR